MENQEYNAEIQMVWKINVTCSDQCYGWKIFKTFKCSKKDQWCSIKMNKAIN